MASLRAFCTKSEASVHIRIASDSFHNTVFFIISYLAYINWLEKCPSGNLNPAYTLHLSACSSMSAKLDMLYHIGSRDAVRDFYI